MTAVCDDVQAVLLHLFPPSGATPLSHHCSPTKPQTLSYKYRAVQRLQTLNTFGSGLQIKKFLIKICFMSYSWVHLVRPYTEELISQPCVGENRFRLVLQARMGPENAIGCIIFPPGATFFLPQTCTLLPLLSGHFKWICAEAGHMDLSNKQIHVTCFSTNLFEMPTE